jgi:Mrp family chromosome partitioning ATPase
MHWSTRESGGSCYCQADGQSLDELKHRYHSRIVVFDLPPVLTSADVLAFGPLLDALLLVTGEGMTRRHDIEDSIVRLKGAVPILGTVLNHTQPGDGKGMPFRRRQKRER